MNEYVIRYAGEIGTKDKSTRWSFINKLSGNIENAINTFGITSVENKINAKWENIVVSTPHPIDEILSRIPGIRNFSLVKTLTFDRVDKLIESAYAFFKASVEDKAFAVRCRRVGKHDFNSKDIECLLGDKLIKNGKVDLSNPDITCYVEIRIDTASLYFSKEDGLGGFPLGTQGKALTLFSGGIDSPVAAWMAYRNGLDQDFLYYDLGGEDQKKTVFETCKYLKKNWGYGSKAKLIIVDFLPVIKEIIDKTESYYHNLILKYCFYIAAEKLAQETKASALITGESIGQVSTQTLKNLAALDQVMPLLVVRPLSTYTKEEIILQAKKIGAFEMSYKGK